MMHSFGSLIELSVRLKSAENRMFKIFNQEEDPNIGYLELNSHHNKLDSYYKNLESIKIDHQPLLDEAQKVTSSQEISKNTSKVQHRCHYCPYFCDSRFHLRRHISSVHNGEKSYKCYVCYKEFSRSEKVKQHFLNIHPDVTYEAKRTRKKMLSINELEMKLQKNKPYMENETSILSDIDSDRAWSKFCMIQNSFLNNAFKCLRCEFVGPHIWKMKEHYLNTHMQHNAYACQICHYVAYKFERLVGHMQGHGELYCVQCIYSTTDLENYSLHTNICSSSRICHICNENLATSPALCNHYTDVHKVQIHICKLCIYATTSIDELAIHEITHKPVLISESSESDLSTVNRYHPCIHKGCQFSSVWKKCLELHIENFHKSEAEISAPGYFPPCSFCPSFRTFKYKKSFQKHLMQHGLKPNQCTKFMTGFYLDGD